MGPPEAADDWIEPPPRPLADALFRPDGLVVIDPIGVLSAFGVTPGPDLLALLPEVVHGGIHEASSGVIQDPAGTAIGSGRPPHGGGASGAIYATFPDLAPIPEIGVGAAVLNASHGPGRRVLHTHSPQLYGNPRSGADRTRVVALLANAYANAITAVHRNCEALGDDALVLNLVPVAASIFAGPFANTDFTHAHLDPSYTLSAALIGAAHARRRGAAIPRLRLYVFAGDVYQATVHQVERLRSTLG